MDGLTVGRNVHYVTDTGIHLLALVVKVWHKDSGVVNLTVFNDHEEYSQDVEIESGGHIDLIDVLGFALTSVVYNEEAIPNTWHWIEKA